MEKNKVAKILDIKAKVAPYKSELLELESSKDKPGYESQDQKVEVFRDLTRRVQRFSMRTSLGLDQEVTPKLEFTVELDGVQKQISLQLSVLHGGIFAYWRSLEEDGQTLTEKVFYDNHPARDNSILDYPLRSMEQAVSDYEQLAYSLTPQEAIQKEFPLNFVNELETTLETAV